MQLRFAAGATIALMMSASLGFAQSEQPPAAPAPQQPSAQHAPQEPQLPPLVDSNFTAATPTRGEVEGFLKTSWGYDTNRIWEVYAIEKTAAPGVSKVTVLIAE